MSDLISRSELHDTICKRFNIEDDWDGDITEPLQTILDIIENFDIAYDVDEVIAELEEKINIVTNQIDRDSTWGILGVRAGYKEAIEIVRNGGKE